MIIRTRTTTMDGLHMTIILLIEKHNDDDDDHHHHHNDVFLAYVIPTKPTTRKAQTAKH